MVAPKINGNNNIYVTQSASAQLDLKDSIFFNLDGVYS